MAGRKPQTVTKWKLDRLRDHPNQDQLFGDVDDVELAELAESMRVHGQRDPVHVLPDGTILGGHKRAMAARRLGWKEVAVVVRADLAAAGPAAAEAFFVEDNLVRRQLSPLARARCIRRLMELDESRPAGSEPRRRRS